MEKYKIRITSRPGAFMEQDLLLAGDCAAMRHGQRLTAPGETLEVLRGEELIFLSGDLGYASMPPLKYASMN
jgi:hypothetical protein